MSLRRWFLFAGILLSILGSQASCRAAQGAEAEWKKYVHAAQGRGVRWTLAELRPTRVAPADDAALLPVFASPKNYTALLDQVPVVSKKRESGAPAAIDWKATRKSVRVPGLKVDPVEPDDVRALDAATRPLNAIVDQLCESKATAANWEDDVWRGDVDAPFWQGMVFMRCYRLLQFRACLDLALGRPAEARRAIEAQLRLVRVASRTPTALFHIIAQAGVSLAREMVWRGLEAGAWDEETLRAFAAKFLELNSIADFCWSMETERAWGREAMERIASDPDKIVKVLGYANPGKLDEPALRKLVINPAWKARNALWQERSMDELISMLDPEAGTWKPVARKFDPEKLTKAERSRDLAACASSPMHGILKNTVWVHAQNQMAAIACALELARRAYGKYPDRLEALAPTYLPRIPVDPTSGEAFRYRVEPDGAYVLYSVGFDRKDGGGKVKREKDRDQEDPDWPWLAPRATKGAQASDPSRN